MENIYQPNILWTPFSIWNGRSTL